MSKLLSGNREINRDINVDDFVVSDDKKFGWSSGLKLQVEKRNNR